MNKKKISIIEYLFIIGIFLIEFATYTRNVINVSQYSKNLINIAIFVLMICAVLTLITIKANIKKWILCIVSVAIAIFSFIKTDDSLLLQLALLIIASLRVDFKSIVKKDLVVKAIILIFILFAYSNNLVETLYFARSGKIRYSFGFNHPNTFGFFIMSAFFEYVYLKKENINKIAFILLTGIVLYLLNLAGSRSSQITIMMFVVLFIAQVISSKRNNKKSKRNIINTNSVALTFIILTVGSLYITKQYELSSYLAEQIDNFFSGRILLQMVFLQNYDINIVGNNVNYFATLDNVYIRILINFGILAWFFFGFIYCKGISKGNKVKNKTIVNIIFVLLIYGLMEWYIIRPALNIFLIYFSALEERENENVGVGVPDDPKKIGGVNDGKINFNNSTNL